MYRAGWICMMSWWIILKHWVHLNSIASLGHGHWAHTMSTECHRRHSIIWSCWSEMPAISFTWDRDASHFIHVRQRCQPFHSRKTESFHSRETEIPAISFMWDRYQPFHSRETEIPAISFMWDRVSEIPVISFTRDGDTSHFIYVCNALLTIPQTQITWLRSHVAAQFGFEYIFEIILSHPRIFLDSFIHSHSPSQFILKRPFLPR